MQYFLEILEFLVIQ